MSKLLSRINNKFQFEREIEEWHNKSKELINAQYNFARSNMDQRDHCYSI